VPIVFWSSLDAAWRSEQRVTFPIESGATARDLLAKARLHLGDWPVLSSDYELLRVGSDLKSIRLITDMDSPLVPLTGCEFHIHPKVSLPHACPVVLQIGGDETAHRIDVRRIGLPSAQLVMGGNDSRNSFSVTAAELVGGGNLIYAVDLVHRSLGFGEKRSNTTWTVSVLFGDTSEMGGDLETYVCITVRFGFIVFDRLAASRGDPEVLCRIGRQCLFPGDSPGDAIVPSEAAQYLKLAADQHHTLAQYDYAVYLSSPEIDDLTAAA
jgi:hypothetical protein